MKKSKKILIIFIIIILIGIFLINLSKVKGADSVKLSLITQPYIDIVLSKGKTQTNLENFEVDLRKALKDEGVDINKVNISAIEGQVVNIEEAFDWTKDVSSSIGSITIKDHGRNVEMKGNKSLPGKNAIWIIPDKDLEQSFTFGYNIDYGDSFNAAGMLLRVKRTGSTLEGYLLSFNKAGKTFADAAGGKNGGIFKFSYEIGKNSTEFKNSLTLIKPLNINQSGTLTVKATRNEIEISGGGLSSPEIYELEDPMGTGFGFFSDHYSHGCDNVGSFILTNINLKTQAVKKIEEVLREPDWREDAIKIMVNVEDVTNQQLNQPASLGELLMRTMNDEIYFVGWGNDENESQIEKFISANDSRGKYINNSQYTNSITETAKYIKSLLDKDQSSNYVILGENTNLLSEDSSIMNNTAGGEYPYGRWKILHDCEYYENNIGQLPQAGKYISDMITSFSKTGKYEILYEDRNIIPKYIYVHRKPVSEIDVNRNNDSITLTSLSYDLDKYSDSNGIAEEEWKYRQVGEETWSEGKLSDISEGTDFLVQLRAKDFQDTWSSASVKYVTKTSSVLPIASFKIKNQRTSIYEELEIVDGSYDPFGGTITDRIWRVYQGEEEKYSGHTPLLDYMDLGAGDYTMALEVTNDRNMTSEVFKRNFTIIPDDEAPEFTATPIDSDWSLSVTVDIKLKDRLGSGVQSYQYAITTSQALPTSWSDEINKENDSITIDQDGIHYLHIKTKDNAGNISEDRVVGPYKIDKTKPDGILSLSEERLTDQPIDIIWEATDGQSGFDRIILPNGNVSKEENGRYSITQMGVYTFIVYDKMGHDREISINVNNVDMKEPKLEVTRKDTIHGEDKWTNEDVILKWKAYDNESGLKEVVLPNSERVTQEEGEYVIEENGTYTIFAYDQIGNGILKRHEVKNIDKSGPELSLISEIKDNGNIKIKWNMTDNQSGIRNIILPNGESSSEQTGEYIVDKDGTYSFVAYDRLGNDTIGKIRVEKVL